ncbi:fructosamine kinase family protein [Flavobacteriaceae bacterium GSB9]|nr:fructosamine kinase family protein [Flavobacteriaceae bacterium GSB9]
MLNDLKTYLSDLLNQKITKISSVSGGDISSAYKIETDKQSFFLKANSNSNALDMFNIEAKGLKAIQNTYTIKTPQILACSSFKNQAFILMEFVDSKQASANDFENLGYQLAKLHQYHDEYFGLNHDNFIGSLPQRNSQHQSWTDFYIKERLLPQLKLAQSKNLLRHEEIPTAESMSKALSSLFENIKPSLLHGDLWSGNFLISNEGTPFLIDPAVYYGHSEVDIAMSKLFSGFGERFYEAYAEIIPFSNETTSRIEIYQLYYLLVHLNMFGRSYYGSVKSILSKHF